MKKVQHGPLVVAAVRRTGFGSFSRAMITQLLCLMAGAFLLTWLLLQTSGLSYTQRVTFLAIAGLAASVIIDLPNWNWWGFSSCSKNLRGSLIRYTRNSSASTFHALYDTAGFALEPKVRLLLREKYGCSSIWPMPGAATAIRKSARRSRGHTEVTERLMAQKTFRRIFQR